jgi:hypothetical protein
MSRRSAHAQHWPFTDSSVAGLGVPPHNDNGTPIMTLSYAMDRWASDTFGGLGMVESMLQEERYIKARKASP